MRKPEINTAVPKKKRDPLLDNARAILITLVVIGHVLEQLNSEFGDTVYLWIYSFHMPAFVVITGFLARSFKGEPRQYERMISSLLLPLFIFQAYQMTVSVAVQGKDFNLNVWKPGWTLWFLVALIIWRLLIPFFRLVRFPLLIAVVISVLAPLDDGTDYFLAWGRVLSFLPFFVLGMQLRPRHLELLRSRAMRIAAIPIFIASFIAAMKLNGYISPRVLHMSRSYEDIDIPALEGTIMRLVLLLAAVVLTFALLALVPRGQYWWTSIGKNSLSVYLFHAALLYPLRGTDYLSDFAALGKVLVMFGAVAVTILTSREWFVRGTRWLTAPPLRPWLVAPDGARDRRGSAS